MPKLLKSGEVQLHMPRTGGKSLAKQIGMIECRGTMHDGPEQIPQEWKNRPTVTTFREPKAWRSSMRNYLRKIESEHIFFFINFKPVDVSNHDVIDPTFGLWHDPDKIFRRFARQNGYRTWYELYLNYFVAPADRIVPISSLDIHIKK